MTFEDFLLSGISFKSRQKMMMNDVSAPPNPLSLTNMVLMGADSISGLSISWFMAHFILVDADTGVNCQLVSSRRLDVDSSKTVSGQPTWLCLPGQFSNCLIFEGHFPILDKWFHKYVSMSGFSPGHTEHIKISK